MREWGYELTTKSGMASAFNKVFNQTGYVSDRIALIQPLKQRNSDKSRKTTDNDQLINHH